jgi:hypothetical protein
MTTNNPDPLEVWNNAVDAYDERLFGITSPVTRSDRVAAHQAAAAIIAQHYAPVIAENERLRQLLPFTRHNINCPVSYGTTADQCLCGLTKARATLAKLEKGRTIGSTRTPSRNDVLEEAAIKEAIKDGLDGWIGITDIPEATDSIIAAIRARKDQTDG